MRLPNAFTDSGSALAAGAVAQVWIVRWHSHFAVKCPNKLKTKGDQMKIGIIAALAIFWIVMAYRQFQRGDMLLGGVFILAGIALTTYRIRKLSD